MMGTVGFLGCFATTMLFQRRRKAIKKLKKKKISKIEDSKSISDKNVEMVDPLMLRAITEIKFRACEELQERNKIENNNTETQNCIPVQHYDYEIIDNSSAMVANH